MATDTNNLEVLRAESQQLGSRITRLSIILISVLTIVTVTITNALEKADLSDLKEQLQTAQSSQKTSYEAYKNKSDELYKPLNGSESEQSLKEEVNRLRVLWEKAFKEQQEAQRRYDALLKESFSINPSLFGSGLQIDLRAWIYSIPFVIVAALIYIQLLRKKQKTLAVVAASYLSHNVETSKFDRLIFSDNPDSETPYARSPAQLEQTIYLLIITVLLSILIVGIRGFRDSLIGIRVYRNFSISSYAPGREFLRDYLLLLRI